MNRERYILAAFSIHQRKATQNGQYITLDRLTDGVKTAMERGADFLLLRRIRPGVGEWHITEKEVDV